MTFSEYGVLRSLSLFTTRFGWKPLMDIRVISPAFYFLLFVLGLYYSFDRLNVLGYCLARHISVSGHCVYYLKMFRYSCFWIEVYDNG